MAAFTTIAAGIGLAATAASAGMSFANAGKQKALAKKAEQSAGIAMEEAKRALGTNYFSSQAIKKEPYELQREALLSQGAKAIEAGVESERGPAPVAGMIQMSMSEGQAALTNAMRQEMTDLENKTLAEESRLRDIGVQINLGEAEGAQLAARDAAEAQARATQQGMQGVTSAIGQVASLVPLFGKSASAEEFKALESNYADSVKSGKLGSRFMDESGKPLPFNKAVEIMGIDTGGLGYGFNVSGVGGMDPLKFQSYMTGQTQANLNKMSGFDFSK